MTEDEARLKLCPLATNPNPEMGDMGWDKEISDIHPAFRCVASKCLMWRWEYGNNYGETDTVMEHYKTDEGYCGLAGKP